MIGNVLYALLSATFVLLYLEHLSFLGLTYFILELIVLSVIIYLEWMAVSNNFE
jgi:hypothetical protein